VLLAARPADRLLAVVGAKRVRLLLQGDVLLLLLLLLLLRG
jgi:hypothetical protein